MSLRIKTEDGDIVVADVGGGAYPPEEGIPESDLSENVKLKLNKDIGTQCEYELIDDDLYITTFHDGRFGEQCIYSVNGNTLTITPIGG